MLARHHSLNRMVAIQRVHHYVQSDPESAARFRREAQVLAALGDPTIVRVFDFLTTSDGAVLAMEFVDGPTLEELIDGGPVPVAQALPILADVAQALTVAAEAGVVHRDVKPGNVFVLRNGRAKLGDFGIARMRADPAVFRTAGPQEAGTPAYFPPEISHGGAEPDARSDAYSFAVMAYEALTGQRPVHGDNPMAVIAAHRFAEIARPETIIPGFPAEAGDALLQGLLKDPATRLLPAQLVERLSAVPSEAWPANRRFAGAPPASGHPRDAPTQRWIPVTPPDSRAPTVLPHRRRRWSARSGRRPHSRQRSRSPWRSCCALIRSLLH